MGNSFYVDSERLAGYPVVGGTNLGRVVNSLLKFPVNFRGINCVKRKTVPFNQLRHSPRTQMGDLCPAHTLLSSTSTDSSTTEGQVENNSQKNRDIVIARLRCTLEYCLVLYMDVFGQCVRVPGSYIVWAR